jgi:hypothetical protein
MTKISQKDMQKTEKDSKEMKKRSRFVFNKEKVKIIKKIKKIKKVEKNCIFVITKKNFE